MPMRRGLAIALLTFMGAIASVYTTPSMAQSSSGNEVSDNASARYETLIADAKASMLIDPDAAEAKANAAKVQAKALSDPRARGGNGNRRMAQG